MDTIRLKFRADKPNNVFFSEHIKEKELELVKQSRSTRWVYTNNTWRNEQVKRGLYIPKYWIEEDYRDPEITYFVAELSVPKFLYGHSLAEVQKDDYPVFEKKFLAFIKQLGLFIFSSQVQHAVPIVFACGKNIDFSQVCTAYQAIQVLSKFNDRFRSEGRVVWFEGAGGLELIFNTKASTFKLYDKLAEIQNLGKTTEEQELIGQIQNGSNLREMVRAELTLKKKQSVKQRLRPFIAGLPILPTLFDPGLWEQLIQIEIDRIFNHPLKNFVFLSMQQAPVIEAFLSEHCKTLKTRNTMLGIIRDIQQYGILEVKRFYTATYCKATWYNYLARLKEMSKSVDFSKLEQLTSAKIHDHLLRECGVKKSTQMLLGFEISGNSGILS